MVRILRLPQRGVQGQITPGGFFGRIDKKDYLSHRWTKHIAEAIQHQNLDKQ